MERQRVTVLAIHGVGNHPVHEIRRALLEHLHDSRVDVQEFNWDTLVPQADSLKATLTETAPAFARSATLGFTDDTLAGRFFSRRLLALHNGCYRLAQACLGVAYTGVLVIPVLLCLGPLWFSLTTDLEWQYFAGPFRSLVLWVGALVVLAAVLICSELLVALCRLRLRTLLMTVRRVVLLALNQQILAATAFLSIRVRGPLPLLAFISLGVLPPALLHVESGAALHDRFGGWIAPVGALAFLIAGLLFSLIIDVVAWCWQSPLKVALDIVRYLGNPEYRLMLQRELAARLGPALDDDQRVVLAAHSLGSIIAIDALVNSICFRAGHRVTLITAGSPLVRCFCRFFPGIFFPPSVASITVAIRRRIDSFTWVNIYRPFDFVGASLGLARHHAGRDLSSKQWWKVFSSHSNYWADPVIIERVQQALAETESAAAVTPEEEFYVAGVAPSVAHVPMLITRLAAVLPFAFIAANAILVASAAGHRDIAWNVKFAQLDGLGVVAAAHVTHWMYGVPNGDYNVHVIDHYKFEFSAADGRRVSAEFETDPRVPLTQRYRLMDTLALQKFIRERCEYLGGTPSWLRAALTVPCRRDGIRVKYLPADPRFFALPDFPGSEGTVWDSVTGPFGMFYLVVTGLICWAVAKHTAMPLLMSFLGFSAAPSKEVSPLRVGGLR